MSSVSLINGHIDRSSMTPQEAVEWLDAIKKKYIHGGDEGFDRKRKIALNTAVEALEKQTPKRAIMKGFRPCEEICSVSYICPVCKKHVNIDKYCYHCGQALDWSDTE